MNILQFPSRFDHIPWHSTELKEVLGSCAESIYRGEASGWEVGRTESGDPQFYLLGPAPDYECLLCISRLGRVYVLEDGNGRVLIEDNGLVSVAQYVREALSRKKGAIVARITVAWYAFRETVEDKAEAMLAETHEVLVHFAPQVVALV
jgi:hypothetical protein